MKFQRKNKLFGKEGYIKINKYSFALVLFIIWVAFFDKHNLINQFKLSQTISELKSDEQKYNEQYKIALKEKEDLMNNKEKYAREHHNFMGENEELFIIKDKE